MEQYGKNGPKQESKSKQTRDLEESIQKLENHIKQQDRLIKELERDLRRLRNDVRTAIAAANTIAANRQRNG